jgi:uncharacterized membrane protein YtjA (UPF0391 family)
MDFSQLALVMDPPSLFALGRSSLLQFSGDFIQWAVIFFIIAIVAAVMGARGVAGVSMTIAKWFVIIFLVLAVVSLLL